MSKKMLPASTPKLTLQDVEQYIQKAKVTDQVVMVGIRGYFSNTMGKSGANDRGIYDDAICLVTPTSFLAVNANVDPSALYKKGVASLTAGVWRYKPGTHGLSHPAGPRRYAAFVQAEPVVVARDGQGPQKPAYLGINIHRGGNATTSSLGCQTIPPAQWSAFKETAYAELKRYNQKTFPYILVNGPGVPVVKA